MEKKKKVVEQLLESGVFKRVDGSKGKGIIVKGGSKTGKTVFTSMIRDALQEKGMHCIGVLDFKDDVGVLRLINHVAGMIKSGGKSLGNSYIILDDIPKDALSLLLNLIIIPLMRDEKLTVVVVNQQQEVIQQLNQKWLFPVEFTTYTENQEYRVNVQYYDVVDKDLCVELC